MALRILLESQDKLLGMKSKEVGDFNSKLHNLLDDLSETMSANDGVGLAAVQIGILRRCLVVNIGDGILEVVNPTLLSQEGEQIGFEGCLSFPDEISITSRPMKIKLKYFDRYGEEKTIEAEGLLAKALSHELDHLDGHVFLDKSLHNLNAKELQQYDDCKNPQIFLNRLLNLYKIYPSKNI